ncbi:hypothetical protein TD95_002067 [Thielaviopsis punctulata]|uniref:Riboflavin kinase n=1 Tax=Thielaviopsis punctulata TaxID=72032 RepID=A0A0F4ZJV1_9PEZI|nr:hypothetical protein TD95_002067 [Thielaviopsis punctulata]
MAPSANHAWDQGTFLSNYVYTSNQEVATAGNFPDERLQRHATYSAAGSSPPSPILRKPVESSFRDASSTATCTTTAPSSLTAIPPPPHPAPHNASFLSLHQPHRDLRKVKSAAVLRSAPASPLDPPPPYSIDDASARVPVSVAPLPSPAWEMPPPASPVLPIPLSPGLSSASPMAPAPPAWKAALGEAQFFATGLISRPAESCRHYTIIRHSLALVWYRGPSTSVSISILSDVALPPARRIFLQQKGFSGNAGMALKAMIRTNDSWIEVTPQTRADPAHLKQSDERAVQRDLVRFAKKATGRAATHTPRETCIVRIPASAQDGYFRLVLCDEKKKVLAGCPVFRIASASTDASVVRGASLRTMPLEIGVKVGSTIAAATVSKYTAPITSTVGASIQKIAWKASVATTVGSTVYEASGLDGHIKEHRENYGTAYRERFAAADKGPGMGEEICIVGPDSGPEKPFPVRFEGVVVQGTGLSRQQLNMPTANLRDVPEHIKTKMGGVYIAWARIIADSTQFPGIYDDWNKAIVTIAPPVNMPPTVVPKNKVSVHILEDFDNVSFVGAKVKVMLMTYLRPALRFATIEEVLDVQSKDILATLVCLGRETWEAEQAVDVSRDQQSQKSVSERLTDLRVMVQDRVDKIPIHKIGVRSESIGLKDEAYGAGGLWIPR